MICTFEALGLGAVKRCNERMSRRRGYDSEISGQHVFTFYSIEYEPTCSSFCCAKQMHLKLFVHDPTVWVCAQSWDVFITACVTKEKRIHAELNVCTCFTWPEWLRAEDLISLVQTYVHSEARVAQLTC